MELTAYHFAGDGRQLCLPLSPTVSNPAAGGGGSGAVAVLPVRDGWAFQVGVPSHLLVRGGRARDVDVLGAVFSLAWTMRRPGDRPESGYALRRGLVVDLAEAGGWVGRSVGRVWSAVRFWEAASVWTVEDLGAGRVRLRWCAEPLFGGVAFGFWVGPGHSLPAGVLAAGLAFLSCADRDGRLNVEWLRSKRRGDVWAEVRRRAGVRSAADFRALLAGWREAGALNDMRRAGADAPVLDCRHSSLRAARCVQDEARRRVWEKRGRGEVVHLDARGPDGGGMSEKFSDIAVPYMYRTRVQAQGPLGGVGVRLPEYRGSFLKFKNELSAPNGERGGDEMAERTAATAARRGPGGLWANEPAAAGLGFPSELRELPGATFQAGEMIATIDRLMLSGRWRGPSTAEIRRLWRQVRRAGAVSADIRLLAVALACLVAHRRRPKRPAGMAWHLLMCYLDHPRLRNARPVERCGSVVHGRDARDCALGELASPPPRTPRPAVPPYYRPHVHSPAPEIVPLSEGAIDEWDYLEVIADIPNDELAASLLRGHVRSESGTNKRFIQKAYDLNSETGRRIERLLGRGNEELK